MLLVVGTIAPDPGSPDPATRFVGRLVLDLAGTKTVVVAAPEGPLGDPEPTDGSDVGFHRLVDVGPELASLTPTDGRRPDGVIVLDPGGGCADAVVEASSVGGALHGVPMVVVLARTLRSAELAAGAERPGAHHLDGLDALVAAERRREAAVLSAASACCCATAEGAEDVAAVLADVADPPPILRLERPRPWGSRPRTGTDGAATTGASRRPTLVAVPGRYQCEPGGPDVDGLVSLVDAMLGPSSAQVHSVFRASSSDAATASDDPDAGGTAAEEPASSQPRPPVGSPPPAVLPDDAAWVPAQRWRDVLAPVGLDGAVAALHPVRRVAGRRGGAGALDERTWGEVLRDAAVVVLARPWGRPDVFVVDDALAAGVPVVAHRAALPAEVEPDGVAVRAVDSACELLHAVATLVDDDAALAEARRAASDAAERRWPEEREQPAATVLRALGARTVEGADRREVDGDELDAPSTGGIRRPAGTLAAAAGAAEAHERSMGLCWVLDRTEGLHVQSNLHPPERYRLWRSTHEETPEELAAMAACCTLSWQPTVSLLVPCWRTAPELLEAMVASVRAQVYARWQLCLVDDASDDPALAARLAELAAEDDRIVVATLDEPSGIVGATNRALALAGGELVGLLDHDDELHPAALWRIVERWCLEPDLDIVYTDEDKLDEHGERCAPHRKPDWNPDLLLEVNYTNHLTVLRRSLVERIGGWRHGFDGAQDHDLWLRATEVTDRIGHVARPLYHWRMVAGSTAATADAKDDAGDAGTRALAEALARRGLAGEVVEGLLPTWHHVRWHHEAEPVVSVVVPTRDGADLVRRCVASLSATTEVPWELVIVDNASRDPDALAYFEDLAAGGATLVRYPHEFHFARQVNLGLAHVRTPLTLVLNNDTAAEAPGWLEEMVAQALRPEVGAVGLRLLFPDGRAQHEGIVLGVGGVAWNLDSGAVAEWGGVVRDCATVTAAAVLARTSVLRAVGGVDESLRVAYNDVDLGLRISSAGWRVLYTPFARLVHAESASRGSLHPMEDEERYITRWGGERDLRDPFYNVSLDLLGADMSVV